MGSSRLRVLDPQLERKESAALSDRELPLPTFDVPYFKYIDEEDEDDEWSSRSQSSTEDDSVDSLLSDRYVVVSGTPEKILEHLLNDLHLEEVQDKETGKGSGCLQLPDPVRRPPLSVPIGARLPQQPKPARAERAVCSVHLPAWPRAVLLQSSKWTHGDPRSCLGSRSTKKAVGRQMFLCLWQFLPNLP